MYACAHQFTVGPRQKMASAKFLEEALSTAVDESAVSALVGSLETQLVTSTTSVPGQSEQPSVVDQNHINSSLPNGGKNSSLKHGVTNGSSDSSSVIISSDSSKLGTENHQNVAGHIVSSIRGVSSASAYAIQVAPSVGFVQSNPSSGVKDGFKVAVNVNPQAASPARVGNGQNVNGSVAVSASSVLQTTSGSIQAISTKGSSMDQAKPPGPAAVVIKSASVGSGVVAGQGGVATAVSGVPSIVTLTKPLTQTVGNQPAATAIVGNAPQILQTGVQGVQILNMNALRPGTPAQGGNKSAGTQRLVINPQVVGNRPVQAGITLQAFQGLAAAQGHLLLKTENGQYQLLRVGPAPVSSAQPSTTTTQTFRPVQTTSASVAANAQSQVPAQNATSTAGSGAAASKGMVDQTKEKCRKFLANLLELSSREPKKVEQSVRNLIQELVNAEVEPENFCDKLEKLLNASPQPCLIGFLKKSLPLLRQSMANKELSIEGIDPPPASVVAASTTVTSTPNQQVQIRGTHVMTTASHMRVLTQPTSVRPGQQLHPHRILMTPGAAGGKVVSSPTAIRLAPQSALRVATPTAIVRTPSGPLTIRPGTMPARNFTTRPVLAQGLRPGTSPLMTATTTIGGHQVILGQRQIINKKSSSGGVYAGDDDINDVALMGGVNLAEESQRILGSTEFVGTQVRSCKDELFLHTQPLAQRIAEIARKHSLEDPSSDVAALLSHATQERLRNFVEKLGVIAEHRIDLNKFDVRYEVTQDIRGQLKCLEEIDKAEKKRHEEHEREVLLRAVKSRNKPEDPEQAKLRAKAREMQRAEMEELRQREANVTALRAIGRKRPRLDDALGSSDSQGGRPMINVRPRVKRVTMRDLVFLLENERETRHSDILFRAYFK